MPWAFFYWVTTAFWDMVVDDEFWIGLAHCASWKEDHLLEWQAKRWSVESSRTFTFVEVVIVFKRMLKFAAVWKGGDGESQRQVTLRRNLSFLSKSVRGVFVRDGKAANWLQFIVLKRPKLFWSTLECPGRLPKLSKFYVFTVGNIALLLCMSYHQLMCIYLKI